MNVCPSFIKFLFLTHFKRLVIFCPPPLPSTPREYNRPISLLLSSSQYFHWDYLTISMSLTHTLSLYLSLSLSLSLFHYESLFLTQRTQTRTYTRAHTYTHTNTHANTHAHTHTRAHTHTHTNKQTLTLSTDHFHSCYFILFTSTISLALPLHHR